MKKYKIIVNPVSGRGAGQEAIPEIQSKLKSLDLDFDLVSTERPMHAAELAGEAVQQGYDVVVSVGGDGTANEVLNGLMGAKAGGSRAAMGVLCVGRGNDFAFGMGIPTDLDDGCRLLAEGQAYPVDVGYVEGGLFPGGRYFGNGIGIGFDAVVGFEALKLKRLSGFLCYMVAALKTIFLYYRAPRILLETDGRKQELASLMVSVMNGRRMGGGFMMAPGGVPDDGRFNLCVVGSVSRIRIFPLIMRFMKGTQASHKAVQMIQTEALDVTALEGTLPAHADGETLCEQGQSLKIKLLPRELSIFRPAGGKESVHTDIS
jgi:YegS/Rv2252/BmrU family lipid kinase